MSINKVILLGNVGKDPETRYNADGGAITNLSFATSDSWTDKTTKERKERTEWHRVVFFGRMAEIAGEYLKKGSKAYLEGSIKTRKWTDKTGVERYTTEVIADKLELLGTTSTQTEDRPTGSGRKSEKAESHFSDMESDIPF